MPTPQMTFDEFVTAQGLIFRAEIGYAGIAAAGFAYTGITTGADELVILQRAYSSSESTLTVELFEATFTGGTDPRFLNRRFTSTQANPATIKQGVTPGTLTAPITGATYRASTGTGQTSISVPGDDSRLYLKPNTSYVVRYKNEGAGVAAIANAFDFRKVLKGNWDGLLVSA
jgi:hypothetical protein